MGNSSQSYMVSSAIQDWTDRQMDLLATPSTMFMVCEDGSAITKSDVVHKYTKISSIAICGQEVAAIFQQNSDNQLQISDRGDYGCSKF